MEAAVCAPGGDVLLASDARALCAFPAQSLTSAACPLLPPAFLPPPMTLDELTALATADPDALKAFVNGQPSAAAAGARACSKGHDALRCGNPCARRTRADARGAQLRFRPASMATARRCLATSRRRGWRQPPRKLRRPPAAQASAAGRAPPRPSSAASPATSGACRGRAAVSRARG
jgi:hypothetical protein